MPVKPTSAGVSPRSACVAARIASAIAESRGASAASVHSRIENYGLSILDAWREAVASNQCCYKYSQFASLYSHWRAEQGLQGRSRTRRRLISLKSPDLPALKSWRLSHDRRKWEVGIALLGLASGQSVSEICRKIDRARRTVERWCSLYEHGGIDCLPLRRSKKLSDASVDKINEKKERLIKIIHQLPKAYGINRASWSLDALSDAYEKTHGKRISTSSISEYFILAGYKFKKAKKSLTSNDPTYREKLAKITNTLSHLASNEKFFSIDEFGPFSVKIRGGIALVPGDEVRTIPQKQRSKGSLICTAALELSSNQVTHFYSKKKNTREMIKLLYRLIILSRAKIAFFSPGIPHRGMSRRRSIKSFTRLTATNSEAATIHHWLNSCLCLLERSF
jgi:transposase